MSEREAPLVAVICAVPLLGEAVTGALEGLAECKFIPRTADAESAPLSDPEFYSYDFDIAAIAEVWRRGSVVSSWLLDLTASALHDQPDLATFQGRVSDSGEGRWTVHAAVDEGVPAHVLTAALYSRYASRGNADFAGRVLSAMRQQFGGHAEQPPTEGAR